MSGRHVLAAALLAGMTLAGCSGSPAEQKQEAAPKVALGGPFTLTDTHGRRVTDATLRGKPFVIFFGFTRCPDACPTAMNRLALLAKKLGPDAGKLNIVFVSVDPEHDKPEAIAGFLGLFDVPAIGLTGTPAQLKQVEDAYKVYVKRIPLGDDYTIDHSTAIYLMDRQGRFFSAMTAHDPVDASADQLRQLLTI